ncbi:ADP-ribose pyrophosphatase [Elusimicrobium minutum Pei191]|uniref:ADP-ribose pyrophosphatase n=1 Tax=Elusimicrobium minutum (strain Pei191) TaxID=445932 RepID=B2KAU0_ELUMP|nr:NUDIX hydrolase [Elusimicrobium minutum]ACC97636.1 ADP-ribose pyrophosphatase [Elusimicrobium minutum Pei191]
MIVSEFSCGGVVLEGRKVLLVQVKNMKGKKLWTFPKGHIEPGETPRQAALREVLEETGHKASIVRPIIRVKYAFTFQGNYVKKTVQWYLMKKLGRIGKPDASEILAVRWVSVTKAKEMVQYPSDLRLIDMVETTLPPGPEVADDFEE